MKLNTGADVTSFPEMTYRRILQSTPTFSKPNCNFRGPNGKKLFILGLFHSRMSTTLESDCPSKQTIYMVRGLRLLFLGHPAIRDLEIFNEIHSVTTGNVSDFHIDTAFPSRFTGIWKFSGPPYQIRLRDDATRCSLSTLRQVPLPMIELVAVELKRMEEL